MNKKRNFFYIGLVFVLGFFTAVVMIKSFSEEDYEINQTVRRSVIHNSDQEKLLSDLHHSDRSVIYLYFSDRENVHLIAEERVLDHSTDPAEFGRQLITGLIKGPTQGYLRTIPEETILRSLYVTRDGTAYVDFSSTVTEKHPGGVQSELLTIYSIVNSLVLNVNEINRVKILIQGNESLTLAGHIDLNAPFKANMLIVR